MRPQVNRLPADAARGFSGSAIDRSQPLRFRLDGRIVSGFAGDTVLSAALASGIDTLGRGRASPIGLTPRATPAISHASLAQDPQRALPMARTLAQDGADYVTLGGRRPGMLARLFQAGRTLGLDLDDLHALDRPWRAVAGAAGPSTELLVIGGGVAGMAAALAGARAGLAVILCEASPYLGGQSGLFGTQEGEDAPEQSMARLAAEVAANEAITTLCATHVFSLRNGLARAHQVETSQGTAQGRVLDIAAPRIVIATGALERLPIFAGNRLPGVIGALDAYELATRFGIWQGHSAVIATSSNPAYRLAMLASDAGITIKRILDSRPNPASRFISFSRAYGIVQSPATLPSSVGIARAGGAVSIHSDRFEAPVLVADRLVVSGGWQPDLTLWHVAGGGSHWQAERHRLEAVGYTDGIALAGSAAGYLTRLGCIQSGADAVDLLLGRNRRMVDDPHIDPLYETPDAPPGMAQEPKDGAPSYLDAGGMLQRPAPVRSGGLWPFGKPRKTGLLVLSEAPQPLAVCDIAAGVDLGLIPPAAAGIVAQERVALVPLARQEDSSEQPAAAPPDPLHVPTYLRGRYGRDGKVVRVRCEEARQFEPGALIYRSADSADPAEAVGVILRKVEADTVALVTAQAAQSGQVFAVRDTGVSQVRLDVLAG